MPTTRAVRITAFGGPEVLQLGDVQVRAPGPGELLVEVAAAGLNRADLLQRRGRYPAPAGVTAEVPGLEYAGIVVETGEGVSAWKQGDRVMGIVGGGGMARHVVVHEREAMPVPQRVSLTEAAAIPEVFLTAFDALFVQGNLRMGECALVHAIASGVGTAALQLARCAGARVVGTSRSQEKLDKVAAIGAFHPVLPVGDRFAAQVRDASGGAGADVVLDPVGGSYLAENLEALALHGRLVIIGQLGGAGATLPIGQLMQKRARIVGTVLRSRPLEEKALLAQRFVREALPLFADGRLRPVVDTVLPMDQVGDAHARLERNESVGKLVLAW